jgi:hypothetical protein
MAEFLTFVATDGLAEVFTDGDGMASDENLFFEKVVGIFGGGANDFQGGDGLVGGTAVGSFEPRSRTDWAWGERVVSFNLFNVNFIGGVKSSVAGDKAKDEVVAFGFDGGRSAKAVS